MFLTVSIMTAFWARPDQLKSFIDNIYVGKIVVSLYDKVENLMKRKENYWLPVFSLFPTMFPTLSEIGIIIVVTFGTSSVIALNLVGPKNVSFGK